RGEVADDGRRMRWLEHLSGVARVEVRVVVGEPGPELGEPLGHQLVRYGETAVGLVPAPAGRPRRHRLDRLNDPVPKLHCGTSVTVCPCGPDLAGRSV